MARKQLIVTRSLPYHVTARSNNREPFHCPLDKVWEVLTNECLFARAAYGAKTHALTLMPNHFHLIISTPNEDLGVVMSKFMRTVAETINLYSGRTGRVFGNRYYKTVIDTPLYFAHATKYLYRNPVKAGLCARVEHYPHSTVKGLVGQGPLEMPLFYPYGGNALPLMPPEASDEFLVWLNRPFQKEHDEAIQKGLRKSRFALPKKTWRKALADLKNPLG
jgi:putative transposase